jgi:hypothetical protein
MMALLDTGKATDINGATAFTYAHPIFWALTLSLEIRVDFEGENERWSLSC